MSLNLVAFALLILEIVIGIASFIVGDKSPKLRMLLGIIFIIILVPLAYTGLSALSRTDENKVTTDPVSIPSSLESLHWTINPSLPEPIGYTGWISSESTADFGASTWTNNIPITITESQMALIFGVSINVPSIGELGTKTSCFIMVSRGPLDISISIKSGRVEISNVDNIANSFEWASQKSMEMKAIYLETCKEKGIDILIGR